MSKQQSDYETLLAFSEKKHAITRPDNPGNFSRRVKSTQEGIIEISSGYLEICEDSRVNATFKKMKINPSSSKWRIPNMLQGDNFVTFKNLWGDGMFAVLSSPKRLYVETDSPTDAERIAERIRKGNIKEPYRFDRCRLEGLVSVGSGSMTIIDPEIHPVTLSNLDEREKYFEMSTILKVEPGKYSCKFIDKNRMLSIRKIST